MKRARCAGEDPDVFFKNRPDKARKVCALCPVQTECAEYAIVAPERFGIWGGLTPEQRRWIRRRRGLIGKVAVPKVRVRATWRIDRVEDVGDASPLAGVLNDLSRFESVGGER